MSGDCWQCLTVICHLRFWNFLRLMPLLTTCWLSIHIWGLWRQRIGPIRFLDRCWKISYSSECLLHFSLRLQYFDCVQLFRILLCFFSCASDLLKRLSVLMGTLNPTHSLTHSLTLTLILHQTRQVGVVKLAELISLSNQFGFYWRPPPSP